MPVASKTRRLGHKDRRPELTQFRMFKSGPCTPAWGHVWTAPGWQGISSRLQQWSRQPCVRDAAYYFSASSRGRVIKIAQTRLGLGPSLKTVGRLVPRPAIPTSGRPRSQLQQPGPPSPGQTLPWSKIIGFSERFDVELRPREDRVLSARLSA